MTSASISVAPAATVARERGRIAGFESGVSVAPVAVGTANLPVPVKKPITFKDMEQGVDAIASASQRARDALDRATAPFGKNGKSFWTSLGFRARGTLYTTVGVCAAGAAYALLGPDSSQYVLLGNGMYHPETMRTLGAARLWMILASSGIGVAAGVGAWLATRAKIAQDNKVMRRAELRKEHVAPFIALRQTAANRPLERAAIGEVASTTLPSLKSREVFFTKEVEAELNNAIADIGLGDAQARAEADRHRAFILAVRAVEKDKNVDAAVAGFIAAFEALEPNEQKAVSEEVYQRLFDGVVPRREAVTYQHAQRLLPLLGKT